MIRRILIAAVATFSLLAGVGGHTSAAAGDTPPAQPRPWIGVGYGGNMNVWTDVQRMDTLDKLDAAGVEWVRMTWGWATFEGRGKGLYESWYLDRLDRLVDEIRARGIKILGLVHDTPGWAEGPNGKTAMPRNAGDFGDAMAFLAARYRGKVDAWELWNEPNLVEFFAERDPALYAKLVRDAYPKMKAVDPGVEVVAGGTAGNDRTFVAGMFAAGVAGNYDVLSTHPYMVPSNLPPDHVGATQDVRSVAAIRELMVANGDGDRPIWFTEIGWSTHASYFWEPPYRQGVDEERQAAYTVRTLDLVVDEIPYVTNVIFYVDRNFEFWDQHVANFGLMRVDGTPKRALGALKSWIDKMPAADDVWIPTPAIAGEADSPADTGTVSESAQANPTAPAGIASGATLAGEAPATSSASATSWDSTWTSIWRIWLRLWFGTA